MYRMENIGTIHLEVTSKCNASCPMCLRNVLGGKVNPQLPITELSLDDVATIFPNTLLENLKKIYLCGNYGDPIMARETLEILEYFRRQNQKVLLELHTNGSARTEEWWSRLAKTANRVVFGIDGLEETNAIYRRGTSWSRIIRNASSFINAGGVADWTFIVFKHNEHQIEEARKLSEKLGFRKFIVKKTGRFFSNTKAEGKDAQEVLSPTGDIEYFIEKPTLAIYQNAALEQEEELKRLHGDLKTYFGRTDISCKSLNESSLYVSAEGLIFPCCWTANQLYPWYYTEKSSQIWSLINRLPLGKDSINAKLRPLEEILADRFFSKDIPDNWKKRSLKEGRLFVCGKTCGQKFDPFKAQFQ